MARIKKEMKKDFTVVHNGFLHDKTLGLTARGLLMTMLSMPEKLPNGESWNFSIRGLASNLPDGKQKVQTALNELEEKGYLMRKTITDEKGRFKDLEYVFSDEIMPEAIEAYKRKVAKEEQRNKLKEMETTISDTDFRDTDRQDINKYYNNKIYSEQICSDKISINQSADSVKKNKISKLYNKKIMID